MVPESVLIVVVPGRKPIFVALGGKPIVVVPGIVLMVS